MTVQEHRRLSRSRAYAKLIFEDYDIPAYVRDLHAQGLRVETLLPFSIPVDTEVRLRVLDGQEPPVTGFPLRAVVRWRRPSTIYTAVGLEITQVDPAAREGFEDLVGHYRDQSSSEV